MSRNKFNFLNSSRTTRNLSRTAAHLGTSDLLDHGQEPIAPVKEAINLTQIFNKARSSLPPEVIQKGVKIRQKIEQRGRQAPASFLDRGNVGRTPDKQPRISANKNKTTFGLSFDPASLPEPASKGSPQKGRKNASFVFAVVDNGSVDPQPVRKTKQMAEAEAVRQKRLTREVLNGKQKSTVSQTRTQIVFNNSGLQATISESKRISQSRKQASQITFGSSASQPVLQTARSKQRAQVVKIKLTTGKNNILGQYLDPGEQKMKSIQTLQAEKFSRQSQQAAMKMKSNVFDTTPIKQEIIHSRNSSNSRYFNRPRDSISSTLQYTNGQNVRAVLASDSKKGLSFTETKAAISKISRQREASRSKANDMYSSDVF